jgi:hypothetical protein
MIRDEVGGIAAGIRRWTVRCRRCGATVVTAPCIDEDALRVLRRHLGETHPADTPGDNAHAGEVVRDFTVEREL